MNIISVSNPQWANQAQTLINLTLDTDKFGVIQFTASANDVEAHGRALFAQAIAGQYGAIAPVDPTVVAAESARQARVAAIAQARADAKADAFVQQFVDMTPAQAKGVAAAASATLPPPMREWAEKMTLMMLAMAKEQYK